MSKPAKVRRHRPYSLNRCWCKGEKLLGKRTIQERRHVLTAEEYPVLAEVWADEPDLLWDART